MIIDLHLHTHLGSVDSVIDPDDLIRRAQAAGLDGIAITEHGHRVPPSVWELAERYRGRFPIFPGMEASSELGDILIFGIDSYPRTLHRAADLRRYVLAAGGVMVAAHPFRWDLSPKPWLPPRDGQLTLEKALSHPLMGLVDALEAINGWATPQEVDFTLEVGRHLGMATTGGSDAHHPRDVGICVTVFHNAVHTLDDLVRELKAGRCHAEDRRPAAKRGPTHAL